MSPISGMIQTHFSLGSFLSSQGRSCSPFRILLDLKYVGGAANRFRAVLDEKIEFDIVFGAVFGAVLGAVLGAVSTGVAKGLVCVLSSSLDLFRAFSREVSSNSCGGSRSFRSMVRDHGNTIMKG
jgi:hypothetical protein